MKPPLLLTALAAAFFFGSCEPDPIPEAEFSVQADRDILVVNEGQFNSMNASLSYINTSDNSVTQSIYSQINSEPLGDILQSGMQHDGEIWLANNNPGSIVILDDETLERKSQILIDGSPKNILFTSGEKVFVSDLFSGVHIVDKGSQTVIHKINPPGGVYEMLSIDDKVIACNVGSYGAPENDLIVYNTETYSIAKSIEVGFSPTSITRSGDYIFAASQGTVEEGLSVAKISVSDLELVNSFSLKDDIATSYNHKIRSYQGDIYLIADGLYSVNFETGEPTKLFDMADYIYGLEINQTTGDIYITDAKDFASQGQLFVLDNTGTVKDQFAVGFNPNSVIAIH